MKNIKKTNYPKHMVSFLLLVFGSYFGNTSPFFSNLTEQQIMMNQKKKEYLALEIYGEKGSHVKVRFNDIPISEISLTDEGSGNSVTMANSFAIPGINTLSVYPLSKKGITTVRLAKYEKGDITGRDSGETLIEINIENDDTPIHQKIELPTDRVRWSWMDTDLIDNEKAREEAIAFSKAFYKIMQQNNVEKMVDAVDPIINDELISKPETTKEKIIEQWTEGLKMGFTKKDIYDDIDTIEIVLIPIANGKLFEVKRKDGSSLFRVSDKNEYVVGFKDIIGRKNGVWQFYH